MNETQQLIQRIEELERKIEELTSTTDLPLELKNALVRNGFLRFRENVYYEGGASGNTFKNIIVDYGNEKIVLAPAGLFTPIAFTVNTGTDTCTSVGHPFSDDHQVFLSTTGTLPAGLNSVDSYWIISSTADTFQLSLDGVNPVNITSTGTGTHYATYFT